MKCFIVNILLQAKIVKLSKMSVIKSLYVEFIELYVDANYIMNLFYISDIATISRITMHQDESAYKRAYVEIYEWHDSEVAYNFIKRLKNPNVETKLIHSDDDWWVVKINNKREEFYFDPKFTTFNHLVDERSMGEEDDDELKYKQVMMSELDKDEEIRDWNEIQKLLDVSRICQNMEFYCQNMDF